MIDFDKRCSLLNDMGDELNEKLEDTLKLKNSEGNNKISLNEITESFSPVVAEHTKDCTVKDLQELLMVMFAVEASAAFQMNSEEQKETEG